MVRRSINDIIAFQIAYRTYEKAINHYLSKENRRTEYNEEWRNSAIKSFFETSTSVYCSVSERGTSIVSSVFFHLIYFNVFRLYQTNSLIILSKNTISQDVHRSLSIHLIATSNLQLISTKWHSVFLENTLYFIRYFCIYSNLVMFCFR